MDFSIIVLTYNPNYDKLFQTLSSILMQKNCTYEIIVSDDGSKNFNGKIISDWMEKRRFCNYRIIENKVNKGTTYNVAMAMKFAKGNFVKLISPGDFIYEENTLQKIYDYMKKNEYNIIFGKGMYYSINEEKKIFLYSKCNPLNLEPYVNYDIKKIKKANLFYKDLILGAAFVCKTQLFEKYINRILELVKYNEDLSYLLMLVDGIEIRYWNDYIVWYEYGTGISTSSNREFGKKLYEDKKKFFYTFGKDYSEMKRIYRIFYGEFNKIHIISKIRRKIRNKKYQNKLLKVKIQDSNLKIKKLEMILNSINEGVKNEDN